MRVSKETRPRSPVSFETGNGGVGCQDCYKCVRECPVKAIRVESGRANVVPELCVACGRYVGAVIEDVTTVELRREQIAKTAKEVIHNNLVTVQEIACRLGEHMADTEILLNAIAKGFTELETQSEESDDAGDRPPALFEAFRPGGG